MPMSPSFWTSMSVVGAGAGQRDLPAGDADRGQERRRFDAVGDHRVLNRVEVLDALDRDGRAAGPGHLGTHPVQEGGEVRDLGLPRGVLDHGRALREDAGHERVLRCAPTLGNSSMICVPRRWSALGLDVAVRELEHAAPSSRGPAGACRSGRARSRRHRAARPAPGRSGRAAGRARRTKHAAPHQLVRRLGRAAVRADREPYRPGSRG